LKFGLLLFPISVVIGSKENCSSSCFINSNFIATIFFEKVIFLSFTFFSLVNSTSSQHLLLQKIHVNQQMRASSPLVISLEKVRHKDILLVGGKGANLGELIHCRFPVPNGFVVTTAAYDQFVEYNHISLVISEVLMKQPKDGSKIREAFERGSISSNLKKAIELAYQNLGQNSVAVRSSATAEDLQEAAFAGQQDIS
jgi:hypothetical protein